MQPGSQIAHFEVLGLVGEGGMGEVYRARDTRLGGDVAIKVLPAQFSDDPERVQRFEQEARAVAALDHPNTLAIHDVGTHDGDHSCYTWMGKQVFLVELAASGRVVRLAHHHSLVDPNQEHDYWAEPQASTNRDLTKVLFTTNWGRSGTDQVEMYMIQLPMDWPARLQSSP